MTNCGLVLGLGLGFGLWLRFFDSSVYVCLAVDLEQPVDQVEEQATFSECDQSNAENCRKKPLVDAHQVLIVH